MFSLKQSWRTRGWNSFCLEAREWGREVAQTMYTYVSKRKTENIKRNKIMKLKENRDQTLNRNAHNIKF
jgi:hypothetical protein